MVYRQMRFTDILNKAEKILRLLPQYWIYPCQGHIAKPEIKIKVSWF